MSSIDVGEVITLTDEEEKEERDFRLMYKFDIRDNEYFVLIPVDQEDQEECEVSFLRYDGDDMLHQIESDEEWDMVEETFNTLIAELEDEEQN